MNRERPPGTPGEPERYGPILDLLPGLAWVASADGTVEYMNRACRDYAGLPLDDLLGWDWGWVVHPSDLPRTLESWTGAVRTGAPHLIEHRLRRHDGQYLWFLTRGEPARIQDGRVVRWFGTCTEIEQFKRQEDQLRVTRRLFRGLVERAWDGVALVATDMTVLYVNPIVTRLLKFQPEELLGMDARGWTHPDDLGELIEWFERLISRPGEQAVLCSRFLHKDGSYRRLEVRATNLMPDPDVRAVAVTFREAPEDT